MKHYLFLGLLVIAANKVCAESVPVMVGGYEELDACSTLAAITERMPLFSAPNASTKVVVTMEKGTYFVICDSAIGGWSGIVFGDDLSSCGLTSPIATRKPYGGECHSGWIKSEKIEIIAG